MTTPHNLDELAARAEAAAGPDRELDHEIRDAVFQPCLNNGAAYTRSLDAAMMLAPEGALWEVEHKINTGTIRGTFARPKGEPKTDFRAGVGVGDVPAQWSYGRSFATPALALTAACLRARASLTRGEG